jgi:hypothetical protein
MMKNTGNEFKLLDRIFGGFWSPWSAVSNKFFAYSGSRHHFLSQQKRWGEAILRVKGWMRAEVIFSIRSPQQNYEK